MGVYNTEDIQKLISADTTIFWFRRDLRFTDNAGLFRALQNQKNVLPIFIFDSVILDKLDDRSDRRVTFIYDALSQLKDVLEELGSSLLVVHDDPIQFYSKVRPKTVYTNEDYEPYARERDGKIAHILSAKGSVFKQYKDQVIFSKDEVLKDDGTPYTVFTPYSKRWKATLTPFYYKSYPIEKYSANLMKIKPLKMPSLADIGFTRNDIDFPERKIKTAIVSKYDKTRDFPAVEGTSRLSVHLRFGTVSIRQLVQIALKKNQTWLNELIWREFYQMILWHYPHVENAFKAKYDNIRWRNNEEEFEAWCEGKTGYPLVDAGMRELNATGFMHNRVRMVTASFLTKHLLIDWRWGEAYFAKKLLDFDLASNNGGWQWAAGSGCDAAPYFRVFNPELQMQKFDPDLKYVKQWVPEFGTDRYPKPIVDHVKARERALNVYKAAVG